MVGLAAALFRDRYSADGFSTIEQLDLATHQCFASLPMEHDIAHALVALTRQRPRRRRVDVAYTKALAKLWRHPPTADLRLRVNPRLTSTVARWVSSTDVIELSPAATERSAAAQREIICHEAAHRVVRDRHGTPAQPHGPEWQALVKAAGFEARATLVKCGESRRRSLNTFTYRHVCPVCQYSRRAKRRVSGWRCPECRAIGLEGRLRVSRL